VKRLASSFAVIWRLSVPYFRSEDRWAGRILLGAVVAIELAIVAINVILNTWYNFFYNTLQDHDWNGFVRAILYFCAIAGVFTLLAVYQTYLNYWLQIRWRRWLTQTYLRQWLNTSAMPLTTRTSASPKI
jgi:vitamin B12/bleomycin/antimicrobial peptide transport system ATP-binding/permease protein